MFDDIKLNKYETILKEALGLLNERQRTFLCLRYGVDCNNYTPSTLEAIGQSQKPALTRERVRQIVNQSKSKILSNEKCAQKMVDLFEDMTDVIEKNGGIIPFDEIMGGLSSFPPQKRQLLYLLLDCATGIKLAVESPFAHQYYYLENKEREVRDIMNTLRRFCKKMRDLDEGVFTKDEIVFMLRKELEASTGFSNVPDELLEKLIVLCKEVEQNIYEEYGHVKNPDIRLHSVSDCLHLILRRSGKPMHYRDLAKEVTNILGYKVNPLYCLNTISGNKDLFVRVGNGTYTLASKGYKPGTVADVIRAIFLENDNKVFTQQEVCDLVLREREVKRPTILKALKENKWFTQKEKGKWTLSTSGVRGLK